MSRDLLPLDLWRFIGLKLDSVADRIRFGAVCKSWMSLLPSRQPPWLMLPAESESEDDDDQNPSHPRGFVSLGDECIYRINIPQLHQARCVGSAGNCIVTIDLNKQMNILNPFSRAELHLPLVTTFEYSIDCGIGEEENLTPQHYRDCFIWKIVLGGGGRCIAVALHHYFRMLSVARPGDASWTTVQTPQWPIRAAIGIEDVIFYKERFYAVNFGAQLLVCDTGDDLNPPKVSFLTDCLLPISPMRKHYLVECSDELLMVIKFVDRFDDAPFYRTNRFHLFKFDFANNKFCELKSLGGHSLFLGYNTSTSVLASSYPGRVKRNCIYFTDDYALGYVGNYINYMEGGHDMGVFDLEDQSITPHYKGVSTSFYSPPIWIVPTQTTM